MFLGVQMISSLIEEEVGGDAWLRVVSLTCFQCLKRVGRIDSQR